MDLRLSIGCGTHINGLCLSVQAIEAGQGAGDDWVEFKYRHRQAEQDSRQLYSALQQAEQFHMVSHS